MSKLKTYVASAMIAAVFCGCERQDIGEYENDPRLYFFKGKIYELSHTTDSMVYSFFFAPEDDDRDTVYVDLRAMGLRANQARPFVLTQADPDLYDPAVSGKHFLPFDSETMKDLWRMPAGRVQYMAPIILLRDASLSEGRVELKLTIGENDYFRKGIDEQQTFRIIFTAKAEMPENWSKWSFAFGDWGERKMWFVMNYLKITDFDDYPSDFAYLDFLKSLAQKQLARYNASNPTLTEADGTVVEF